MKKRPKGSWLLLIGAIAVFAVALVPVIGGALLGDTRMIFLHGGFFVGVGVILLGLSWGIATGRIG
jgi:hypothetical protein